MTRLPTHDPVRSAWHDDASDTAPHPAERYPGATLVVGLVIAGIIAIGIGLIFLAVKGL